MDTDIIRLRKTYTHIRNLHRYGFWPERIYLYPFAPLLALMHYVFMFHWKFCQTEKSLSCSISLPPTICLLNARGLSCIGCSCALDQRARVQFFSTMWQPNMIFFYWDQYVKHTFTRARAHTKVVNALGFTLNMIPNALSPIKNPTLGGVASFDPHMTQKIKILTPCHSLSSRLWASAEQMSLYSNCLFYGPSTLQIKSKAKAKSLSLSLSLTERGEYRKRWKQNYCTKSLICAQLN